MVLGPQNRVNARWSVRLALSHRKTYLKTGIQLLHLFGQYCSLICISQTYSYFLLRWLYALIITIDANFRLKLKARGLKEDPALGDGWAHWVESGPYQEYVDRYGHQIEVSSRSDRSKARLTFFGSKAIATRLCMQQRSLPRGRTVPYSNIVVWGAVSAVVMVLYSRTGLVILPRENG